MKKSMKINAAKYGLRLITFETGHYDMCGYFKDNETKKYAYFSFHECRNHPIDFDMMNSKGFLIRSAKGLKIDWDAQWKVSTERAYLSSDPTHPIYLGNNRRFYIDPTWYDLGAESPKKEEKETPPSCGCCCG